jgi:hypothetical protein
LAPNLGLIHARNGSRFHILWNFPLRDVSNLGYGAITFLSYCARSI